MQDDVGGLQVLNEDNNTWFDVGAARSEFYIFPDSL